MRFHDNNLREATRARWRNFVICFAAAFVAFSVFAYVAERVASSLPFAGGLQ